MPKIFISYRRADSAETSNRLYDRLVYAFGRDNVFKDVDSLQRGDDFPQKLLAAVKECDVFLAVIGKRWLTVQDEAGKRRLDNPKDWVRQETMLALERGNACALIPTLVEEATLPPAAHLPKPLKPLADRDAQTLTTSGFHDDVSTLIESIRRRFGLFNRPGGTDVRKAHRDLVEVMKAKSWDAARGIVAAMRAEGNVPVHFGLDTIERQLYRKLYEEQRDRDYESLKHNAELVEIGLFPPEEVIAGLEAYWQIYPDPPNYDPDNLARFQPVASELSGQKSVQGRNIRSRKAKLQVASEEMGRKLRTSLEAAAPHPPPTDTKTLTQQLTAAVLTILPPPFDWCFVPGGSVTLETKPPKTYSVDDFLIAKYPITNAQFQTFYEARGGYTDEKDYHWFNFSEEARFYRTRPHRPRPTAFTGDVLPRTNLSWFDAIAFCLWLGNRIGQTITLPTEQQWQRAAIGDTNWEYPWGNEFEPTRCNTQESGIGHPVNVTNYPNGVSPFGVFQMSGNVYDWCLNNYHDPNDTKLDSVVGERAVRGGSWSNAHNTTPRTTRRRDAVPSNNGNNNVGFRCVISLTDSNL